jgi:hypothetical protein
MFDQTNPVQHGAVVHNCARSFRDYSSRKNRNDSLYGKPATQESETIQRGEPCFYSEMSEDQHTGFGNGVPIYTSFNGVNFTDRKQLKDELVFEGVATTDLPFNEKTSTNDPVTAQVGGIATMMNTWKYKLNVGDTIILSPPLEDFSNCSKLPSSMGPKAKEKIRPVTKRFSFKTHSRVRKNLQEPKLGEMDFDSKDPTKNPSMANKVENVTENLACSTWLAAKTPAVVALSMQPYILKLVEDYLETAMFDGVAQTTLGITRVATELIARLMTEKFGLTFTGDFNTNNPTVVAVHTIGQFCSVMLGIPHAADELLTITYDARTYQFMKIREDSIAELKKRLTTPAFAFGDVSSRDARVNSFKLPIRDATDSSKRRWTNPSLDFASAISVVENYPQMVTKDCEVALARKSRRICGKVLQGGEPGGAVDVLLSGTKLVGTH